MSRRIDVGTRQRLLDLLLKGTSIEAAAQRFGFSYGRIWKMAKVAESRGDLPRGTVKAKGKRKAR